MREKNVDLLLSMGIIFVVMGHVYQLPWFFFPSYTFHVPLFFFISGYLFSIKLSIREKIIFTVKKIKGQVLPYYLLNIFFLLILIVLHQRGLFLNYQITVKSFLIEPFLTGTQNPLMIPLWFLLQLFIVNITMQFLYWNNDQKQIILMSLLILVVSTFAIYKGLLHYQGIKLLIVRTGFSMLFFQLGIIFKYYKEGIDRYLLNSTLVLLAWILVVTLSAFFGRIDYAIITGSVENPIFFVPIITTIIIIIICYIICTLFAEKIDTKSLIMIIGQNSFYIMAFHLSGFYIVNLGFYALRLVEKHELDYIYFGFQVQKYFILYYLFGILIPMIVFWLVSVFKRKFKTIAFK